MKGGLKWSVSAIRLEGQILDEFWTLWTNEFLKGPIPIGALKFENSLMGEVRKSSAIRTYLSVISVLIVVVGRELVVETSRLRCMLLEREKGDCLVRPRQLKDLMKDYMDNVMLYHGIGRRSEAKNEFELDLRQSDLVFKEKDELWKEKGWSNSQDASNIKCSRDLGQRVWKDREEVHIGYYKLMNLQLGENVTVLWAITGESKLNGPNLVHETTNKIAVIQERLEAAKLSKEVNLVKVRWDSKRGPELLGNARSNEGQGVKKRNGMYYGVVNCWNSKCNFELT
ncbi:hypothetical protein Tco_1313591 [Tanacetum coccineum]